MSKTSKNQTISSQIYLILTLLAVLLAFFIGFGINVSQDFFEELSSNTIIQTIKTETKVYVPSGKQVYIKEIDIPAVSAQEEGITGKISVIIKEGNGFILGDVGNILISEDTEHSLRTAAFYAFNYSGRDISRYDVIYRLDIDAPAIEGASAGAAVTIATISALMDYDLKEEVVITGTINHDGSIGPANGIVEKAKAAKVLGKSLFLVSYTQSELIEPDTYEHCQKYGDVEFCATESTMKQTNISEVAGIAIQEVNNISEALDYFIIPKQK